MRTYVKTDVTIKLTEEDWNKLRNARFRHVVNGIHLTIEREDMEGFSWGPNDERLPRRKEALKHESDDS